MITLLKNGKIYDGTGNEPYGDAMARTIRKMTGGVADRFSLKDRGYINSGCFADITVFNEEKLKNAAPDQPKSFGIEKVFINGKLVLEDGNIDKTLLKNAGHAVRSLATLQEY